MPDHKKDKTGERTHQRYGWQHIVEHVLKGYDFDAPPRLEALRSRAGLAFRVDAVTAGRAKRYLLRAINHNFYSAAEIRSELHWLTALDCETDLTVQTPIPREDGEFLTSSSQQWNWTLFQWLPGTHIDPQTIREDQCERLGELLAKIHLHSEEFSPANWFVRPELDCRRLIGDGEFSPPPDGGAVFSQDEFRLINQLADNARDRWAEVSKSAGARRLIHSDLSDANVLWDDDRFNPIDFADCGWGFFPDDVATALAFFYLRRSDCAAIREAILSGYTRLRPAASSEMEHLDYFLVIRALHRIRLALRACANRPAVYRSSAASISNILRLAREALAGDGEFAMLGSDQGSDRSLAALPLLNRLRRAGVEIAYDKERDRLRVTAPKGVMSESLRLEIGRSKEDIIRFLRQTERISKGYSITKARRPPDGRLPLSFAQERLFVLYQLDPESAAYNIPAAFLMQGTLHVGTFIASVEEIVRRHEVFRTSFAMVDGRAVQQVAPVGTAPLLIVDLKHLTIEEREKTGRQWIGREASRPFDLGRERLLRVFLLDLGGGEFLLMINVHHIISDGWSRGVFIRELTELYAAFLHGRRSPLPESEFQYGDYALWQRQWLTGEVLDQQLDYWRQRLAGASGILELPADRPRPRVQTFAGAREKILLTESLQQDIETFTQAQDVTLFMLVVATVTMLLSRYTGQYDLMVGTPIAGRNRAELEDLIGLFVNTLVLRADLTRDPTFGELLGRVRDLTLGAYAHQDLPFEKLVEEIQPERNLSQTPLFQVMTTVDNNPATPWRLEALTLIPLRTEARTAKFDLTFYYGVSKISIEYNRDLFDVTTVRRFLRHWQSVLTAAVSDPRKRLSRFGILTPAERQQLAVEWNDTAVPRASQRLLPELFAAQVERTPDGVAVQFKDQQLSYRELDRRVESLSRHLCRLGVGPEVRVGVCAQRSPELVTALLAVHRAGGAYVPLDPDYPAERLGVMIRTAAPAVLLAQNAVAERLPESDAARVDLDDAGWRTLPENRTTAAAGYADSPAHVIFTSGSTGQPKGCTNSHRAIANRLLWMQETRQLELGPGDRLLQKTPFSFDVSVWEFFAPLTTGACLVLARPGGHRDPVYLHRIIRGRRITAVHFVASMLRSFLESAELEAGNSLRWMIASGEALAPDLRHRLAKLPNPVLHDLYGPTETAVEVTCERCDGASGNDAVVIGRPISNLRMHILDPTLRPVPVGVAGELCIAGMGLGRGYHARPGLTAERFPANPEGREAGERMYRTGDLTRFLPDGRIEFLGRIDHQVKIRGFRIELGEIEAVLRRHPAVGEVVVVNREDGSGTQTLAAYLTPHDEVPGGDREWLRPLRGFLEERLPEYMVPAAFTALDALPLTASGKVDRNALPAPGAESGEAELVVPETPLEEILAGIWAEVLGRERVGTRDDFFALGGHSLLATRVISRIRRHLGVELPLHSFFQVPTVAQLARRVEQATGTELPALAPLPREGNPPFVPLRGNLPLSFAQERLWFIDRMVTPGEPGAVAYNIPAAIRLHGSLNVSLLVASLNAIVRRHESLRTTFREIDGRPVQVVAPSLEVVAPVVDLSALAQERQETRARELAAVEAARPFDLRRGPLVRALLLRLTPQEHVAVFTLHHIISDGWSQGLLVRELSAWYAALAGGSPAPLPELPIQYADFAVWQRRWLAGEALDQELAWWRQELAASPQVLDLPTDRPRPPVQSFRGRSEPVQLAPELTRTLQELARRQGATVFMTLAAAFQVLLSRYAGQEEFLLGTPIANRNHAEIEELIGLFVNTLVMRCDLTGDPSFEQLLARVRRAALDGELRPVPIAVAGELVIGGPGLARGYLRRPAFTAARFVPDPFCGAPAGERLYRTGDRVRRLADGGQLEFLGRIDHQVKLRGLRIELGEIEAVLSRSESLRECVVVAREEDPGDLRLVAYLVPAATESAPVVGELRGLLHKSLPDYMVPSAWVVLDALPRTPTGKVDRAALARRSVGETDPEAARATPRDALELQLTRIWEELLGVQGVGIRSDFFELGGHSLLAVRLMARIRRQFGQDLPLTTMFQHGTVERLAAMIRQQAGGVMSRRALVAIRPQGSKPPFFCVHPVGGDVFCYGELARAVEADRPFYALQVPDRGGELFLTTLEEMAAHYVEAIREVQPEGPYRLGGWSMGGVVAFAMAHRLAEQNQRVERLVLIDSRVPTASSHTGSIVDETALALLFARDVGSLFGVELVSSSTPDSFATVEEVLALLHRKMHLAGVAPPDLELCQIERLFAMFRINFLALRRYCPPSYDGGLILIKAEESVVQEPSSPDWGWSELAAAGVTVHVAGGNHYSMMQKPYVEALAARLSEVLYTA